MKKYLLLLCICCGLLYNAYPQASQPKKQTRKSIVHADPSPVVPAGLKEKFRIAYPEATNQSWSNEDYCYKVTFMDKNMPQVVVYDTTGKVVRKETALDGDTGSGNIQSSPGRKSKKKSRRQ